MNGMKYLLGGCLLFMASCSSSSDDESGLPVSFQAVQEGPNPNFVTLMAAGEETDTYLWTVADKTLTGKKVTCYLERKGTYEVSLKQTRGSLQGTATQNVVVKDDSYYYKQGETLWWNDEFEGNKLDNHSWNYDTGTGKWGNHEWQNYTAKPENSFLRDGMLVLKTIKSGTGQKEGDYTSARLTTQGKRELNRGRVEVRAKLPGGVGLWPAIWLYGTKAQPYYSELDLMEYVGCDKNIIYGAVHTTATLESTEKVSSSLKADDVENTFHIYGMNWTDGKIEYYLDTPDNVYLSFMPSVTDNPRIWPFDSELYLILNIAVGGDWGGMHGVDDAIFPQEMEVDYVRIFKRKQ